MKEKMLMKTCCLIVIAALFSLSCAHAPDSANVDDRMQRSREIARSFMTSLKGELQAALQSDGFGGAIGVCKTASAEIEDQASEADPAIVRVRRVSMKTRNPERHTPTPAETEMLQRFERQVSEGVLPSPMTVHDEGLVTVMFPIVINDPVCVVCHGAEDQIPAEVIDALKREYPHDRARGYAMGDLRGALTVEWMQ